ncbi:hypothetical protein [Nodosilinea sp. E11]|uniref:hypothetical protein n=1 Tax=Nodosilinea sp. E11 TaxID=3037479 RepID=UPI0029345E88|nr:hypothetical protein [Nodosilinea sp. E11]WOD37646.1 hypothetical protein RRF56_15665 [Nodosilinea sp. E11]
MTIPLLTPSKCLLILVLLTCLSCQAPLPPGSPPVSEATVLTIEATASGQGIFDLAGTTNLPDNTQLTAIALRYLDPETALVSDASGGAIAPLKAPFYSVLDYQPVTVTKGQWSSQLTLWQVADDGRYQEPWQNQTKALNLTAQPRDTVQFAITLAPHRLGAAMSDILAQEGRRRIAGVLRVTATGEPFLWADQSLPVSLPQGQTAPPTDLVARTNGGWGQRYLLVPEPPLPYTLTPEDERQTTAPFNPAELLH